MQSFDPLPSEAKDIVAVLYPQFSLDDTLLTDGRFIFDVDEGKMIADLQTERGNLFYSSFSTPRFSEDGDFTFTTSEKMIYLYSIEEGKLIHEIEVSDLCNLYYLKIAPDMEKYACAIKNRIVIREFPFLLDQ